MSTSLAGSGSLYIGDLHPDITESTLYDEFKSLGPIISIRVCRDTMSRISLGYAYVNFQNPIDAERAIETMNHMPIKGKPVRIMWSQRDPAMRRSGVGNVFVKGLEKDIDNRVLYDTFSAYGNILSCKVVTDEASESKGFGFVHYDTDEAAKKAVEALNESELRGTKIFVGPFIKRSQRQSGLLSRFTNVYVKDIVDVDAEDLKGHFAKFGEVTSAFTKKDLNLNKVFGFVNYAKHEEAVEAIEQWHGKHVEGLSREENDPIYVQRAMKRAERELELRKRFLAEKAKRQFPPANNLYVKNLDENTTEVELRKIFSAFGEITSCVIMKELGNKNSKGFGFVCFKEAEQAQKALQDMNGKLYGDKPLYVNIAQKKDARRSMLELQYAQRRQMPPHVFMHGYPMLPGYAQYGMNGYPPKAGKGGMPMPMPGYGGRGGMKGGKGMPMGAPGGRGGFHPAAAAGRGGARPPKVHNMRPVPVAEAAPAAEEPKIPVLTAETLAAMAPDEQKNALGEQLWYKIHESHPDQAAKITGMLHTPRLNPTLSHTTHPRPSLRYASRDGRQ